MPKKPNDTYIDLVEDISNSNFDYSEKELKEVYREENKQLKKVIEFVSGLYVTKNVVDGLLKPSKVEKAKIKLRFNNLLTFIGVTLGNNETRVTTDILKNVTEETYYKQLFILQAGFSNNLRFSRLTAKQIDEIIYQNLKGKMFSQRIWDNQSVLITDLHKLLNNSMTKGVSIDKISREVRNKFSTSAYNALRLCQTELARVQSDASAKVYKESDVIKKVTYIATLDNRTSKVCQNLDGKMFNANDDYPKPPQHPLCRSVIVPIVDGWEPTTRLENIKTNGEKTVINYTTYDKWKKARGL